MRDTPTTPLRVSREPSLIPSPTMATRLSLPGNVQQKRRYTSSPPSKMQTNANFQAEKRNTMLSRVPQTNELKYSGNSSSSNLTKFYKNNVVELNELQETLYKKKSILDTKIDEYETYKLQHQEIQIRWDNMSSEKRKIENDLRLKQNELKRCKNDSVEKKRILERGHQLHLKELEAKNQSELNKLKNEYNMKIEKLKQDRIKEFEKKRNDLLEQVEGKRNKILTNDTTLAELKQELDNKYLCLREEWLEKYQSNWTAEIDKRTKMTQDIEKYEKELNNDINPKVETLTKKLNEAKSKYEELQTVLQKRSSETKDLVTQIAEKTEQINETKINSEKLTQKVEDIKNKLILVNNELVKEETIRRILHNNLQELRGNIRVYCRIRPTLAKENKDTEHLKISPFDDTNGTQQIEISKNNIHANSTSTQNFNFKFDKIFNTKDNNTDVFNEVGQLVQSALDGYNVCIFAYGQTGSGKTYTMLNPEDGIIPSTIVHIFNWTENLKERGWKYSITCQFVEIYNENIVDLLRSSNSNDDTEATTRHDIRHNMETQDTTITNVTTCELDSEATVEAVLRRASKLRSTASTKSNEHSSRSHSIFIVHLKGENSMTGERSEGTLNLIDLAGSERINVAHVDGERLRETQHINKSLSCLGDVIHALNDSSVNKRHIPFRNSKLTYLLQNSLTGNSKTLMFVNISGASNHINETLNSLRFASKVNATKMQKGNI